jgi:predicted permease
VIRFAERPFDIGIGLLAAMAVAVSLVVLGVQLDAV